MTVLYQITDTQPPEKISLALWASNPIRFDCSGTVEKGLSYVKKVKKKKLLNVVSIYFYRF